VWRRLFEVSELKKEGRMSDSETTAGELRQKTPIHLWIVGVLALLWNAMGAFDYLATKLKLSFYMSNFTQEQLDYFYGFPAWATVGWAFGVWGAVAGTIGLLMRRSWAVWAYAVSLAGMVLNSVYTLVLTNGMDLMGAGAGFFTLLIWVVAIFLLVYSYLMAKKGVLS
jgi:hypothetical protein